MRDNMKKIRMSKNHVYGFRFVSQYCFAMPVGSGFRPTDEVGEEVTQLRVGSAFILLGLRIVFKER